MSSASAKLASVSILITLFLAACSDPERDREEIQSLDGLNVIDESDLNDVMMNFADPDQAAQHFRNLLVKDPERSEIRRGYAVSLMRANKPDQAAIAYAKLVEDGDATDGDRLMYAEALIRNNSWAEAEQQLNMIPPTIETYDRYRLEAMVADYNQNWEKSDSFYDIARGLTTRPAPIYNNWGISMMSRGSFSEAEEKFRQAISFDPKMFNAKNNLTISRARQGRYELPVMPLSEMERAELLHNMALQAIRNGDTDVGRGLLEEAIDVHPQHFEQAVNKLSALEKTVVR